VGLEDFAFFSQAKQKAARGVIFGCETPANSQLSKNL